MPAVAIRFAPCFSATVMAVMACGGQSTVPAKPNPTNSGTIATAPPADKAPAAAAVPTPSPPEPPPPVATKGEHATAIAKRLGPPKYDLGGAEGEACFSWASHPLEEVCFGIGTEQAPWSAVLGEDYKVGMVRTLDEAPKPDGELVTLVDANAKPEKDVAEPAH